MAIDRAATLRNAEKLLRQGKLEGAITEYLRIVQEQPRDWNTANTVGDLYVRVGKMDKAVEQFIRIADSLQEEGFLPKAVAVYKKVLKLKPDHEHALLQAAEIAGSQGLYADARTYLNTVIERRRARGDKRGAAQARIILGGLDPADYAARSDAARARGEINDMAGTVRDLREIAAELSEKGRAAEAIDALQEAAVLQPDDEGIRSQLFDVYISTEDFASARESAVTIGQLDALAGALEQRGKDEEALAVLQEAVSRDPSDSTIHGRLARMFVARGDMASAAQYMTVETANGDPELLVNIAEIYLRGGRMDAGLEVARTLLKEDPARRERIALIGWNVAEHQPEAGFKVVELAADVSVAENDWAAAAAALQEYVTRVPNHIPALMRLVEICVDGGLEATMYSAQAQLADAYIAAGSATEARFIAEDLVAREPWERANVERFRKALVLSGEADPDTVIAERLSGSSPFMSTDLNAGDFPPFEPDAPGDDSSGSGTEHLADDAGGGEAHAEAHVEARGRPEPLVGAEHASKADHSLEVEQVPEAAGEGHPTFEGVEVDLNIVLDDMNQSAATPVSPSTQRVSEPVDAADVEDVFSHLRDEASRRNAVEVAERDYRRGLELRQAGDIDGCLTALKSASRAPSLRFATASTIGRIYRDRKLVPQAIEWLERAAQAPAPNADEYHALLFDLADGLESTGEVARALAICLELHADAGSYRDVTARIDRLSKVQARG